MEIFITPGNKNYLLDASGQVGTFREIAQVIEVKYHKNGAI